MVRSGLKAEQQLPGSKFWEVEEEISRLASQLTEAIDAAIISRKS